MIGAMHAATAPDLVTLVAEEKGLILKAITPEPKENLEWPYRPMQADARDVNLGTSADAFTMFFMCTDCVVRQLHRSRLELDVQKRCAY